MMVLDCPAWLDEVGALRCGLPAEVRYRFTMRSADGPIEAAAVRCPSGHWFNGPVESLTWDRDYEHEAGLRQHQVLPAVGQQVSRRWPGRTSMRGTPATLNRIKPAESAPAADPPVT